MVVDPSVELYIFTPDNPELRKILNMQIDFYSLRLLDLLSMQSTGLYDKSYTEIEIDYCNKVLDWLNISANIDNKNIP